MDEPNLLKMRRTPEEIMQDVREGRLDIGDVKIKTVVQIDEIDMSGDAPRLTRSRTHIDGEQTEVINY